MVAFFDDSGSGKPDAEKFFAWGTVCVPATYIRELNDSWVELVQSRLNTINPPWIDGIEPRATDLYSLSRSIGSSKQLEPNKKRLVDAGLNTESLVDAFIQDIYRFLSAPPVPVKYVGAVTHKIKFFERQSQYFAWQKAKKQNDVTTRNKLSELLAEKVTINSFEWMAQRANSLADDEDEGKDFRYTDGFIVGDESAFSGKRIQKRQALAQAGFSQPFSNLDHLVNRCWFGSSLHDPCLQIADWIAYTLRRWAEQKEDAEARLKQIQHLFRGYPNKVFTRGISLWPAADDFPKWPPWENEPPPNSMRQHRLLS